MDVVGALKFVANIRVSCDDRWLVWYMSEWVVYQRKFGAKKTTVVCRTKSQARAVKALVDGE